MIRNCLFALHLLLPTVTLLQNAHGDTLHVTSSGVGINTSSPGSHRLTVQGGVPTGSSVHIKGVNVDAELVLESTGTSTQLNQAIQFKDYGVTWYLGQRYANAALHDFGLGITDDKDEFIFTAGGKLGIGTYPYSDLHVAGYVRSDQLAGVSYSDACASNLGDLFICPSSLRYKENVHSFDSGLRTIKRLRPVTFTWKKDSHKGVGDDIGLIAEEVASVDPRLATRNSSGAIEGVSHLRLSAYFVSAIQEQQALIDEQREMINALREELKDVKASLLDRGRAN
jgi:hypothetical protein